MTQYTSRVKCGHCHGYHRTTREVMFCVSGPRGVVVPANNTRQLAAGFSPDYDPWSQLKTPKEMILKIKEGRYAVRPDSNTPLVFMRISYPKQGKKKGCLVVQTQHSDFYRDKMVYNPSTGRLFIAPHKAREIDMPLMLIAVDPVTGIRKYASELGVCGRCGRELTDERSRWYGIGPECEKHWPEVLTAVDEEKGPYRPGLD